MNDLSTEQKKTMSDLSKEITNQSKELKDYQEKQKTVWFWAFTLISFVLLFQAIFVLYS